MRSSWMIQVVPKATDKCPFKRWKRRCRSERIRPYEEGGSDRSDEARGQAMPGATRGRKRKEPNLC